MNIWYPQGWQITFVGSMEQIEVFHDPARIAIEQAFMATEGRSPTFFLAIDSTLQRAAITEGRRSAIIYDAVVLLTGGKETQHTWDFCPLIREGQPQALPVHLEHDRDHWQLANHVCAEHCGRRQQKTLVVYVSAEKWEETLGRELQIWLYNERMLQYFSRAFIPRGLPGLNERFILREDVQEPDLDQLRQLGEMWIDFLDPHLQERVIELRRTARR